MLTCYRIVEDMKLTNTEAALLESIQAGVDPVAVLIEANATEREVDRVNLALCKLERAGLIRMVYLISGGSDAERRAA